ncbi:MAG: class I tRNA ligase family protein, partial [Patescibacteria group bacterium]|nr:class I tRNA ligase family protein [Patescibacteria group bacterium]
EKKVKIYGSGHDKILKHWLKNLHDWNISRQIVWGIRIPVWYCLGSGSSTNSSPENFNKETPSSFAVPTRHSAGSPVKESPFSGTLFDRFYPTSVMETGYDILPFWVMRMLMMGIYTTGRVPFKKVYLHGLVRDEKGQKMSKSKGNVVNPVSVINKYGADALRMSLIMSTTAGKDSSTGEGKIRGMRNLTNKIWNAGRFVKGLTSFAATKVRNSGTSESSEPTNFGDRQFKNKLNKVIKAVTKQLEDMKPGLAAETVYSEFWHWFCDESIEKAKKEKISYPVLFEGLKVFLKLLHPFVPFVTEAVWEQLGEKKLLIESKWPNV